MVYVKHIIQYLFILIKLIKHFCINLKNFYHEPKNIIFS